MVDTAMECSMGSKSAWVSSARCHFPNTVAEKQTRSVQFAAIYGKGYLAGGGISK
jgi:hypothetical protein